MSKLISVIIPVFNDEFNLRNCLDAIYTSNAKDFEVIVVDDFSKNNLVHLSKTFNCIYIRLEKNYGPAYARNRGVQAANGRIILFIDSDCVPMENWVLKFSDELLRTNQHDPSVVAVQGRVMSKNGFISKCHDYTGYAYVQNKDRCSLEFLNTSCVAVLKDTFLEVKGFSEDMRNGEDPELALKLVENGKKILYEPSIWVLHEHGVKSFIHMVFTHKKWGKAIGLKLMLKHPQRFKWILPLLKRPWIHILLIMPIALITSLKIVVINFKTDLMVLLYFPFILINKISFRWAIFLTTIR